MNLSNLPQVVSQGQETFLLHAWVQVHIDNPYISLSQRDWAAVLSDPEMRAEGPLAQFQSALWYWQSRNKRSQERIRKRLARYGAHTAAVEQLLSGPEAVNEICGWFEVDESSRIEMFHPGVAGLSWQQTKALELSMRFVDEDGEPNYSAIARHMERMQPGSNGNGRVHITASTAEVHVERARLKLLTWLRRPRAKEVKSSLKTPCRKCQRPHNEDHEFCKRCEGDLQREWENVGRPLPYRKWLKEKYP